MKPGIRAMRRRCLCGEMFSQRHTSDRLCPTCRPLRVRVKHETEDALVRRWMATERERWAVYIVEAFEPFHGQSWLNDVINHLYGKPMKPAKKTSAA